MLEIAAPTQSLQLRSYPVRLRIRRPERQRTLTNLPLGFGTLFRIILLTPSVAFLVVFGYALLPLAYVGSTFVILFAGRYPVGLFRLLVGITRWTANSTAYLFHLYDEYPPLDLENRPESALQFSVEYPYKPSKLLNFPVLGILVKALLCTPHFLMLTGLYFLAGAIVFLASFAVVFSHRFPIGLYEMVEGILRWGLRVNGYLLGFTDRYPPFSLS